ncbi:uncharacterized protein [Elaeis guineensis]|uniref:uncharacterized protein isoform X1 n=1 Tax=Elaeis guineensis var. tenera TaxID=51953 RepID=UPI003C6D8615
MSGSAAVSGACWQLLGHNCHQMQIPSSLPGLIDYMSGPMVEKKLKCLMACVAWLIWLARCARIYSHTSSNPQNILRQASLISQVTSASGGKSFISSSVPWTEFLAAWLGVKAAILYLNASKIWLEGDSQIVVSWISSSNNEKYDTNPLMPDLKNWRRRCSSFNISHTHREANQLADYFAQQAMTMDFQTENVVHLDSYALQILNTDAHGITYQKGGITMFYLCTLLISSSTDDPVYNYCTELHC